MCDRLNHTVVIGT